MWNRIAIDFFYVDDTQEFVYIAVKLGKNMKQLFTKKISKRLVLTTMLKNCFKYYWKNKEGIAVKKNFTEKAGNDLYGQTIQKLLSLTVALKLQIEWRENMLIEF